MPEEISILNYLDLDVTNCEPLKNRLADLEVKLTKALKLEKLVQFDQMMVHRTVGRSTHDSELVIGASLNYDHTQRFGFSASIIFERYIDSVIERHDRFTVPITLFGAVNAIRSRDINKTPNKTPDQFGVLVGTYLTLFKELCDGGYQPYGKSNYYPRLIGSTDNKLAPINFRKSGDPVESIYCLIIPNA